MKLGAVGTATNNSLSSAFVAWGGPHRMSYTFLSDFPSNRETWWTENMQGLCHTNDSWVFAYRGSNAYVVVKIPFWERLSGSTTATARFELPYGNGESGGLDHIGDPDCDDEFVFLAAEDISDRTTLPHIIVLRSSDLAEVTRFPLFGNGQDMQAPWVAIKGKNQFGDYTLVSSPNKITNGVGIKFYGWSPVGLNAWNEGDGPDLLDDRGAPLTRPNMQGGDYSPDQQALYISVGAHTINPFTSGVSEYVYAFDPNGAQYGRSSRSGDWWGPFPYVSGDHEGEGIDFFDVAGKNIPGVPSGQLHVVLLNPDARQDNVWIKHYDNRWQFATP
jgi:hypothetical protein